MKLKAENSRKLRYGGVTAVLTALIIAAVIVFNVIFTALGRKFLWYADLTPELFFTLSDNCLDLIENGDPTFEESTSPIQMVDKMREEKRAEAEAKGETFDDKDLKIKLIFCDDPDAWESNSSQLFVLETAKQLEEKFPDYFEVIHHNVVWNPSSVSQYGTTVTRTSVIVECGTEFRVRDVQSFYVFNEDGTPWAYNGEKIFASAILAVTRAEAPVACITTNHGEAFADKEFATTLELAGFEVKTLNLSTEEIPADCRLIVVFNPQTDFLVNNGTTSDIDEIDKLDRFLENNNSLMVFMSPDLTTPLENFEDYLAEWGISYDRTATIDGGKTTYHPHIVRDPSQSLTVDGYTVRGEYYPAGSGALLTEELRDMTNPPMMVFPNAMPISFSDLYSPAHTTGTDGALSYDYATFEGDGSYRYIYDVFTTSANAVAMANGMERERATAQNPLKLMTVSMETQNIVEDNTIGSYMSESSYVIACGSTEFASQAFLQSTAFGNSAFLEYALRTIGQEPVPVGIKFKQFGDYTMDTVTTAEATQYTVVLTVVPAVLALGAGIFVLVRRKYR